MPGGNSALQAEKQQYLHLNDIKYRHYNDKVNNTRKITYSYKKAI